MYRYTLCVTVEIGKIILLKMTLKAPCSLILSKDVIEDADSHKLLFIPTIFIKVTF